MKNRFKSFEVTTNNNGTLPKNKTKPVRNNAYESPHYTTVQSKPVPIISTSNYGDNNIDHDYYPYNQYKENRDQSIVTPNLVEEMVEKTVKSLMREMMLILSDQSDNIKIMNQHAEHHKQRIEKLEDQQVILEMLSQDKLHLSNLIAGTSKDILEKIIEIKQDQSEEVRKLQHSNETETKALDTKLDKMQKSLDDVVDEVRKLDEKMNNLHVLYSELKFKGNPSKPSMLSTFLGRGKEPVQKETKLVASQPFYSTVSFSVFPNSGYEKATDQLINLIGEQCNSNQTYINFKTKTKIEEYENGEKVLFIRYCGSTRFESPDASALLEKGCKIVFILLTYGDKTIDIKLPSQFQSCAFMQIQINGMYYHNTQDLVGMHDQKQCKLFQLITSQFTEQ